MFGWEMPGNRGTTQTVAFKGTIESATKIPARLAARFAVMVATGQRRKRSEMTFNQTLDVKNSSVT